MKVIAITALAAAAVTVGAIGYARFNFENERVAADRVSEQDARVHASRAKAQELLGKSTQQMIADAGDAEQRQAVETEDRASKLRAEAKAAAELERAERRCIYAFEEQHTGVEPVPGQYKGGPSTGGDGFVFVFVVRLADSFRKDPVGIMTCETRGDYLSPKLAKIRQ